MKSVSNAACVVGRSPLGLSMKSVDDMSTAGQAPPLAAADSASALANDLFLAAYAAHLRLGTRKILCTPRPPIRQPLRALGFRVQQLGISGTEDPVHTTTAVIRPQGSGFTV